MAGPKAGRRPRREGDGSPSGTERAAETDSKTEPDDLNVYPVGEVDDARETAYLRALNEIQAGRFPDEEPEPDAAEQEEGPALTPGSSEAEEIVTEAVVSARVARMAVPSAPDMRPMMPGSSDLVAALRRMRQALDDVIEAIEREPR